MKNIKLLFCLLAILLLYNEILIADSLTVNKVISPVAMDGQLEESFWDTSTQMTINLSGSNNTANFGVLWDDTYLYIGVNVVDATLCLNGRQGWYDDGVEIYIDGNNNQGTTFDQFDRAFVKPVKSYWIQEYDGRNDGVIHNYIETLNGYSMEFAIPWANFNITPMSGMNIGFNIAVNDDENCINYSNPPSRLLWTGTSNYYQNPSTWGTLNLSSQTVSYSSDYLALINPNGGDFCTNNKTATINWVNNNISNVNIDYSTDGGNSWNSIASNLPASSGSYTWNVSATPSDQCLIKIYDTNNATLNDISETLFTISTSLTGVQPLIPNIWENYKWPYNAYYPLDPNGINGHVGNSCGPSSLARILHTWEFPIVGNDSLTFSDNSGFSWSANFGATTYNYDNMPAYLPSHATEPEYTDVATLMYHAAVSMHDVWGSGTNISNMSYAMNHYFNYKVSAPTERKNYTRAEWMQTLISELDSGRVLLVEGMTLEIPGNWHLTNNVAGHWYNVDGYNERGQFHVVRGYGNEDGYFDADSLLDFSFNLGILSGLEPELNGKTLSLQSPNGGEILNAGDTSDIFWSCTNVSNIQIDYTDDNGQTWYEIVSNTPASASPFSWTIPNSNSNQCKIKVTDVTDINIYDKSDSVFSISPYGLTLSSPNGGEVYVQGTEIPISWEVTSIPNIKIEYSTDNGSNWTFIAASVPASSSVYNWIIPNIISDQCKVKISDVSNGIIYDESDNVFEIIEENLIGGPYAIDSNTVVLMHFENTLINESPLSNDGNSHGGGISFNPNTLSSFGMCLNLDNYNSVSQSYITIPHTHHLNLQESWTIEMWFNISSWGNSHNSFPGLIIKPTQSWESNFYIELKSPNELVCGGFYESGNQYKVSSNNNLCTANQWYHIALVKNAFSSNLELYLHDENRTLIQSKSITVGASVLPDTSLNDVRLGFGVYPETYFDGYIDELRISNIARNYNVNTITDFSVEIPEAFVLYDNFPNPFNPVTNIRFGVPKAANIKLSIYNVLGQQITTLVDKQFKAGYHTVQFDASNYASGFYFYRLKADGFYSIKRMLLMK